MARVEVDAQTLADLCELVDRLLSHALEDPILGHATIRAVPQQDIDALRGAVAEVRCHAVAAA